MTDLLRRGRLEVETDLLLGVEEVLLLERATLRSAEIGTETETGRGAGQPTASPIASGAAKAAARGFDAALFAPGGAGPHAGSERSTSAPSGAPPASRAVPLQPAAAPAPSPSLAASAPIVDRIVPPAAASKAERLALLDAIHARECPHCTSATAHTRLVFGEGNPDAELAFVGEAPGETEDQLGRPFVGRAGEKLNEMIAAMGLSRTDVYIANVLKSRPPENRTPLAHEVDRCGPYLLAQLAIISPKAIVTLGGPASKLLLSSELGITRLRGVLASVRIGTAAGAPVDVPVMPTFHPAYLLRNYTPETRMQVWEDLKKVLAVLGRPVPQRK